ncbi:MAG TPA: UDP-N-acetylglucosamine 2-epimerase (non-hydrolyzing) [Methylophilaceae bacterium]|nr:UDP-N-acetylglucosamine 2-epimerase (non-hydrolyzing) [Methylophilaceae bacterium]HAJ72593.1 UDP-N-acetylglucosamine 2-epimerase (non-hydrolyzing) [Methylophilaceae bacterium]
MKKLKVMTIVGTRPELIRLSRVIAKLDDYMHHILVHTGQNYDYELNEIFFKDLKIRKPDFYLEAVGNTAAETIGNIIARVDNLLDKENPDAILILGDTNSCLAAISAKKRRIPIFHMEAGNRCFDQRVPEESNRKIVDHLSDINMPYSAIAREYLLREGVPPQQIIKTGSPMYEVLEYYRKSIDESDVLERLNLIAGQYFVVSCHREENVDSPQNLDQLINVLHMLSADYGLEIIVSTHPRTRKRLEEKNVSFSPLVHLMKPLGFFDYVHLQMNARIVLSDSGTITEESSILNFPALNIRHAHERPEGMEEASVMMVGLDYERINQAVHILESLERSTVSPLRLPSDYNVDNVSEKVARVILSYTDYVNRFVWHKAI